jgi:uncharacterized membrane protein
MHIVNELAETVTVNDQEYKEIVEEYKEEILVLEEVQEPLLTDLADTAPAQGKPRCITLILQIIIYICCVFTLQELYIYIYTHTHPHKSY